MRFYCLKQHDITGCGAACLAMVSKQYGLKMPISKIREVAGTDKQGKIFEYTAKCAVNKKLYELYTNSFISQGYSEYESQFEALKKIQTGYSINFWEVK